jgi:hypothetical protein
VPVIYLGTEERPGRVLIDGMLILHGPSETYFLADPKGDFHGDILPRIPSFSQDEKASRRDKSMLAKANAKGL